jgi:FtsP/CotA-like multicopper oxidase with cupredoxin domain
MLGVLGVGAVTAVAASCGLGGGKGSPTASGSGGDYSSAAGATVPTPQELRSSNGLLELELAAAPVMLPWNDGERYALAYNGSVPGPTLRVRPGDTLRITLRNSLDQPTNLHTHGLHVSPVGDSDNVFVMVDPGESHTYEYRIPADHLSGLFWYHPHHHGQVAPQLSAGMVGAIVVSDAADDDPVLRGATERILVLSDPKIGPDAGVLDVSPTERQQGRQGDVVLLNGAYEPVVTAAAGSVERWRILNAGASRFYRLTTSGAPMMLIGSDQGLLEAPVAVTGLVLTPGQRADILVPIGTAPVSLVADTIDRTMSMGGMGRGGMGMGSGGSTTTSAAPVAVLTVNPTGSSAAPTIGRLNVAQVRPSIETVDERRAISFGAMSMGNAEFVIDGRSFDANRIDTAARLDTTEEWTITNNSMMDHPFHIHVWPFKVTSRSDGAPDPGWRDTVNVPTGGSVTIRMPISDFGGTTVYHCHIVDHEDLGMMATIQVT